MRTDGGTSGLVEEFAGLEFELKNPLTKSAAMEVRPALPPLLAERGWKFEFSNPGGRTFTLQPGEGRTIVMRLHPGEPFDAQVVAHAQDRTIHMLGYAGGILIGGVSYELDPRIRRPRDRGKERPHDDRGRCNALAEALLDCLDLLSVRIDRVSVRRITFDIDLDEDRD